MPKTALLSVAASDARHYLRHRLTALLLHHHRQLCPHPSGSSIAGRSTSEKLHGTLAAWDRLLFDRRAAVAPPDCPSLEWPAPVKELLPPPNALTKSLLAEVRRSLCDSAASESLLSQLQTELNMAAEAIRQLSAEHKKINAAVKFQTRGDMVQVVWPGPRLMLVPFAGDNRGDSASTGNTAHCARYTIRQVQLECLRSRYRADTGPRRSFDHALVSLLARCVSSWLQAALLPISNCECGP